MLDTEIVSVPSKYCYECKQIKPLEAFHNNRARSDGKSPECIPCRKKIDAERTRTYTNSRTKAMRTVGFSREDYERVYKQQNGLCAMCSKPETGRNQWGVKKLAVDHNHETGKFRGLLCYSCNIKLAILEDRDFVAAAQTYLSRHNKLPHEWPEGGRLL